MSTRPTGTVTFLFTDIEGSTRRWDDRPLAMATALSRHDALLRAAIETHGGHVFKTVGDAFCAAFARPEQALAAAVAGQRALETADWGELGPIRVRMALHAGAAEERDGDYFGPSVNRVARLLAAGHGGQVLLSRAARELVRDALPANLRLSDLGEHRLKDLRDSERLFQLEIDGLQSAFPPPRTLDGLLRGLPTPPTPLIGRERELADGLRAVRDGGVRLLTLTGPGGAGKTRLSIELASLLGLDLADGAVFVPLADVTDPRQVPLTLAAVLGVREVGGRSLEEVLPEELRARRLLLVLDNLEQVTAAGGFIADLLLACPYLSMIVTSRVRLLLRGEHELPVPPLGLPGPGALPPLAQLGEFEAIRLFVERAQAVRPSFELTDANAADVAEICRRLDGLPLAIELAAARSRLLTPRAMLERMDRQRGLDALGEGPRDLPDRQRTMRSTIAWSYGLLTDDERTLFRRLAVFAGGFDLETAEALVGALTGGDRGHDGPPLIDRLASLVDGSLVRVDNDWGEGTRFDLFETIRAYGLEKLEESDEHAAVRDVHASLQVNLAERAAAQLQGREQTEWLDRLDREHANLRAALVWLRDGQRADAALRLSAALWRFWWMRGHFGDGRTQLETTLAMPSAAGPTVDRANALNGAGVLAEAQSDFERAAELHEAALTICRAIGDTQCIAWSLNNLGVIALHQGDDQRAEQLLSENLTLSEQAGDRTGVATALIDLGQLAHGRGDFLQAMALYEDSLERFRAMGDDANAARALNNLGVVALDLGDLERSRSTLDETLSLRRAVGDKQGLAQTLNNLAEVARRQGQLVEAAELLEESRALAEETGDKLCTAIALDNLAALALAGGQTDLAEAHFQDALRLYRIAGDWLGVTACLDGLTRAAAGQGRARDAVRFGGLAASIAQQHELDLGDLGDRSVDDLYGSLRTELGEAAFADAWATGAAMPLEAAIGPVAPASRREATVGRR